tara:strand:+ start:12266 stop:13468 length:1203 start_codon:yes stop_codon:yes gene_type:complete
MKLTFILLILSLSFSSFSFETIAIVRTKKFKAKKRKVVLEDLISSTHFEGKYFKIVEAKSTTPISLSTKDKELHLKASSVYYHLTKARKYFVTRLNSEFVKKQKQMTIRLEIKNVFNELGHFANDNLDPQYNNALSIPQGSGYEPANIRPWGPEIWFRPKKIIKYKDLDKKPKLGSFKAAFKQFRRQIHLPTLNRFLGDLFIRKTYDNLTQSQKIDSLIRTAGASLVLETLIFNGNIIEWLFTRKKYWLDSALVPEIIYHEYTHQALADSININISSPVNEGLADYFAAKISGQEKLAEKIKRYNTFNGKNAKNKKLFKLEYETNGFANTDFVLGLLYGLEDIIGQDTDRFLYELRTNVETSSSIREELTKSIINTFEKSKLYGPIKRLKILRYLHLKGI